MWRRLSRAWQVCRRLGHKQAKFFQGPVALLKQSLEKQLAQFNKPLEKTKGGRGVIHDDVGRDVLSEAEKSLAVVEASQDAIKRSCVQVASDHEASVKAVAEELKAAGLVKTFSRTRSARFAHFRN